MAFTKKVLAPGANVQYDPIFNQGGELYINYGYGNNGNRFMTHGQCVYVGFNGGTGVNAGSSSYTNGLSCINDDAMLGIGNDYAINPTATNPGSAMTSWSSDVLVYSAENCDGGRPSTMMGSDAGLSSSIAGYARTSDTYTYTIWTRSSRRAS